VTPTELALWLAADVDERADALASLVEAGDLVPIDTDTGMTVARAHAREITNYELDGMPASPAASA
jgi:hypothetical protein